MTGDYMSFLNKSDVHKHLSRKVSAHNLAVVSESPLALVEEKTGETPSTPLIAPVDTPAMPE